MTADTDLAPAIATLLDSTAIGHLGWEPLDDIAPPASPPPPHPKPGRS